MGRNEDCISQMSEAGTTELRSSRNLEWIGESLTRLPPNGNSQGLETLHQSKWQESSRNYHLKVSFINFSRVCVWVCGCVCWCLGGQRPQIPVAGVTGGCELPNMF